MRKKRELSDEQWFQIKEIFPPYRTGRPPKDHRLMFEAILWIARTGAPWRDLPICYGPFETVYSRFKNWQKTGLLEKLFLELSKDADTENLSIDSTSIKARQHSAGAKKGLKIQK